MTRKTLPPADHILDLMTLEATEGLNPQEADRLDAYFREHPEHDRDGLLEAAAMLELTNVDASETLPSALRDRCLRSFAAGDHLSATSGAHEYTPAAAPSAAPVVLKLQRRLSLAWLATAAAVVLAVVGWWQAAAPTVVTPPVPTLAEIRQAADLRTAPWAGQVPGYQDVQGEVLWSDAAQFGYMVFRNLPPNDPREAQYQLWIVDPQRDDEPVDGGVFDIAAQGEALVPINSKLPVQNPAAFAITREKPGGAVVSEGPLLIVAAVDS